MNRMIMPTMLALVLAALGTTTATARNTKAMWPLAEALATPGAREKLDPHVQLFFGNTAHPPVAQSFGVFTSNKKTNGTGKSDKEACEWAFLSAMLSLQERATKMGGDAVVNIRSYYDKHEISSETEYECGSGDLMSGVTFRGEVVKLKK